MKIIIGKHEATIYPGPKGNTVFNAATIFWAQGLASPPGPNVLGRLWSRPLSKVISAAGRSSPGTRTSRSSALVTISSANCGRS